MRDEHREPGGSPIQHLRDRLTATGAGVAVAVLGPPVQTDTVTTDTVLDRPSLPPLPAVTGLQAVLDRFRAAAVTEREKGTYFEELTVCYLKNEPAYADLYREVLPYSEWADRQGLDKRDVGIDLVAETFADEVHAIQCKLYAADYRIQKADIDSFFTASGKKPFAHRVIVATTNQWSEHAEDALLGQQIQVTKIDLATLEASVIDWSRFAPEEKPRLRPKKSLLPHQATAVNKVRMGLQEHERGKLVMACGTGKTFTSLKLAEELGGEGSRVLFLVPSLALLSQTLTEWTQESEVPLHNFAVCSDSDVGKRRKKGILPRVVDRAA